MSQSLPSLSEPAEASIIYEDQAIVAVYKPERMHSAPGQGAGDLCSWVFERYPESAEIRGRPGGGKSEEGGILHRLDYETSGLVLFARDEASFKVLLEAQAAGRFYKEYLAVVTSALVEEPLGSRPARGCPLGLSASRWGQARDVEGYGQADPGPMIAQLQAALAGEKAGSPADFPGQSRGSLGIACFFRPYGPRGARVACLAENPKGKAGDIYHSDILAAQLLAGEAPEEPARAVIRLGLARGFRHQLRAQLAWIGLPISGDPLYGGKADTRLRLYARRLSFYHPLDGRAFSVSLPEA